MEAGKLQRRKEFGSRSLKEKALNDKKTYKKLDPLKGKAS